MNTRRFVSLIIFLATLFALPLLPVSIAFASGATWTNQTTGTSASGLSWQSINSSSDGTKLAAVDRGKGIAYARVSEWVSSWETRKERRSPRGV